MNLVIPGLTLNSALESSPDQLMASFERHWIPASAGMAFVPFARRIDNTICSPGQ
jgi:hypothetical protein